MQMVAVIECFLNSSTLVVLPPFLLTPTSPSSFSSSHWCASRRFFFLFAKYLRVNLKGEGFVDLVELSTSYLRALNGPQLRKE
jgi:hypothetical protein